MEEQCSELELIELAFLEELEAGQNPTLEGYVAKYPQHEAGLREFIPAALDHHRKLKIEDVREAFIKRWQSYSDEEKISAQNRLIKAIFGDEEEEEPDFENMPIEEVHAYLRENGIDPDSLVGKLNERLESLGIRRSGQ